MVECVCDEQFVLEFSIDVEMYLKGLCVYSLNTSASPKIYPLSSLLALYSNIYTDCQLVTIHSTVYHIN